MDFRVKDRFSQGDKLTAREGNCLVAAQKWVVRLDDMDGISLITKLHEATDGTQSGDVASLCERCSKVKVNKNKMMMPFLVKCINQIAAARSVPIVKVLSATNMVRGLNINVNQDADVLTLKCCDLVGLTEEDRECNYIKQREQDIKGMVKKITEFVDNPNTTSEDHYTVLGSPGGGKSMMMFLVCMHLWLSGKKCIWVHQNVTVKKKKYKVVFMPYNKGQAALVLNDVTS